MTDHERFEKLLRARHPCVSISTAEEDYALSVIRDVALSSGLPLKLWTVITGLRDGLLSGGMGSRETENPAACLYRLTQENGRWITVMLDLAGHLSDARTLRMCRDLLQHCQRTGSTLVLLDHDAQLAPVIAACSTRLEISLPGEEEIEQLIRITLRDHHQERNIEVNMTRKGLRTIIRNMRGLTRGQIQRIIIETIIDDRRFDEDDINGVLAGKRRALQCGGLLEFVETPVDLGEIGGLQRLKTWLARRQDAVSDQAVDFGLSAPRGVLMLGVQGAGKSLCAKAIATAWQRPLLRMDVGALYDRYVGESEKRLRDALAQAEMMAPIVLWIDEIEKAFASSASRSTDGGLSQRMFGTLLTWMQEHAEAVFLVATANDIEALPPELLRKGRFDEIFFVDLPTLDPRREILSIHLRKRGREPTDFDLDRLARAADGFSGAELEQAVISGMHEAFAARRPLTTQDVLDAIEGSPPLSVTMAERVANLREWARYRCVLAE